MRISAEAKEKTRQSILDAAQRLFSTAGFDQTSTRDLSSEAGIATGTLFNYFPTKESLALAIVADAIDKARGDFESRLRPDASLDEALFDHVAAGLRRLAPHRHWVTQVMDGSLGPLSAGPSPPTDAGDRIRLEHLATVRAVSVQLYWTLYLGLLAFWSRDASPGQEDTLVLLDESMRLFVQSLAHVNDRSEHNDAPHFPHAGRAD
ncbi:MAG: TetR family transcriptional regulator [Planctomycetota bacterium]|jgi:AcrR family transcriptional regulator